MEPSEVTPELIAELIGLLANPRQDVKHGVYSAFLQCCTTLETKKLIIEVPYLDALRCDILNPALTTVCLSSLISLSEEESLRGHLEKQFKMIPQLLRENKNPLAEELSLLLLLNCCKDPKLSLILTQDDGYFMLVLLSLLDNPQSKKWLILSIFVDVSAQQQGRTYISEHKTYAKLLPLLFSEEANVRLNVLKLLRNCAFRWENEEFILQFLSNEHRIIDRLMVLCLLLMECQSLFYDQGKIKALVNSYGMTTKPIQATVPQCLEHMELCLQILLITSNCDFKSKEISFDKQNLKEVLSLLKFMDIREASKDQIDALEIFCL